METDQLIAKEYASSALTPHLDLTDPTEAFMAGWISRVHTNRPRLFVAINLKRAEPKAGGQTNRRIIELALWRGQPRCYMVIIWDIDEISMRWQEFTGRPTALSSYAQLL